MGLSKVESRLEKLGLVVPPPAPPIANYVGAVQSGNVVWVSGHGPWRDGRFEYTGKVGSEITVAEGREAAELVALCCLASLRAEIGDLDRVSRVIKLLGMVNCAPDFTQHPEVIDGASDLLVAVFPNSGKHARSAVGMASLPRNISVEIEMIFEIRR